MSDATITIRGVDPKTWKEFQTGIVGLHGNLYGNVGQEATKALNLWLDRYHGRRLAVGVPPDRISVFYRHIGGLKEEIRTMKEAVETPLKHPELFRWLNLIPPKGVLIHGPRGTGKTILARAATAEAKANLFVLSIQQVLNEFNEMGLRGIFQKAKESIPSVILIPDLGTITSGHQEAPEHQYVGQVLSWLLSEIDALEDFSQIVVIGVASSPEELEPSVRRRFKQEIKVSFPDRQGRYEILKIITDKMPVADDVDLEKLADLTDRYNGDLLYKICQNAATHALRRTLAHEKITDEKIAQEKLERIKVKMDDILKALNSAKPEV